MPNKTSDLVVELGLVNDHTKLSAKAGTAGHFYDAMLVSCEKLFDNEIELQAFEDQLRSMFGTKVNRSVGVLSSSS